LGDAAVDSPAGSQKRIVDNALRRTVFADGERRPDDYEVRHDGQTVLRLRSTGRELWHWTQIGWGPTHGPDGGVADSLNSTANARAASWQNHRS
jgi:hypothetical protein